MAVRTITTRLALDGERQFRTEMASVNASLREMKSAMALTEAQFKGQANTVEALAAKDRLLRQEVEQQTEKVKALKQAVKDAAQVYGENSRNVTMYQTQLNRAQAELINMNRALDQNSRYLREAEESFYHTAHSLDEFGNEIRDAGDDTEQMGDSVTALAGALQAAGVAYALKEIAGAIRECVDSSMEFETAMANFNKVAKLSDSELAVMKEKIKQLSTEMPATTSEIAQVAEASRRLGISQDYLLEFTRVMVDLGKVSDLSSDQAATALARFANILGTSAQDYERMGSTIVALGNNFATSESEITEMASRLASAGKLAHLTEAQIMGLAAAMSSVGIQAEAGGTAMTQTLTAMEKAVTAGGKTLDQFAEIAGMSARQFSDAWKNDPITAIQAFIAGLGGLDEKGESATQVLEELGLSGIRQSNMLKSLALASETLTSAVDTASQAWVNNTELAETAAAKYDTTQAKVQMAANAANNLKIAVGDQLTPALGMLAGAGAGAFSWAAEFINENPILVSAITGVVAAMGVMAAGFTAFAAKAALATIATTAWGAALMATPIGPVAAGIGLVVGAFTAVAAAADRAKDSNEELRESLENSQAAYEESLAAVQGQGKSLMDSVAALESLAAVENKSAMEKETMLALVDSLNEAVPNLTLAYDAQTDSLNMTGDAIRRLAQAELDRQNQAAAVDRMKELLLEEAQITSQLTEATNRQTEAEDNLARVRAQIAAGNYSEKITEYEIALEDAQAQVGELTATLTENKGKQDELAASVEAAGTALKAAGDTANNTASSMEDLTERSGELEKVTAELCKAEDMLAKALKEQREEGSLSYETTRKLIDAGYGAALAIDEESGALRLNKELYVQITQAKIDEQLATLQAAAASNQAAIAAQDEAMNVAGTAEAYFRAAEAKRELEGQQVSYSAQIAALNALKSSIGSVTGETQRASRAARSAGKQAKTQAQKDLETYKQLKAELDHQKNLELVDEAEYYRQMAGYRDAYLTDDANLSEYRKVTEQIFKYDKSLAEKEIDLWEDQSDKLLDELEKRVDSVSKEQEKIENKLGDYGGLFEIEDDRMSLNSLQDQISAIETYGDALDRLRERGVSGGLMDEVLGMDVDSATQYARQLLAMSDRQWEQYNALWEQKQETAARIAEAFFKDQVDALENEYNAKLGDALDELAETSFQSGVDTAQGLIDGLASMEGAIGGKIQSIKAQLNEIWAGAGRIPSNAELAASFSPERFREQYQGVTPQDLQNVGAGIVNGVNTGNGGAVYPPVDVTLSMDDTVLARKLVKPMQTANSENPPVKDDG